MRYVCYDILKVNLTKELLIQGYPYVLITFTDSMTGINYVKCYRYKVFDEVAAIDWSHPIRTYRYDELSRYGVIEDVQGYFTTKEEAITNDSLINTSDAFMPYELVHMYLRSQPSA